MVFRNKNPPGFRRFKTPTIGSRQGIITGLEPAIAMHKSKVRLRVADQLLICFSAAGLTPLELQRAGDRRPIELITASP